ncbi:uncharacterized protein LOC126834399 [Adelges cooleyi]|uniref:uncharacterized protein LOC126834399 n=1 Tax=Adelges cooleyi TaxID=133065 RepID=UPI00217F3BE1|nr:uncharacterized protein LOC126834399 [Adelges cooleyi]
MVRKCIVCKLPMNTGNKEISFHSFPKDPARRKLWMKACMINLHLASYAVCSNHFLPEQYLPCGYLKKDAVPVVALPSSSSAVNQLLPRQSYAARIRQLAGPSQTQTQPSGTLVSTPVGLLLVVKNKEPETRDPATPSPEFSTVATSPSPGPPTGRRRIYNPCHIGDLKAEHFDSPGRAERLVKMIKQKYKTKQSQCKKMKGKIRRLENKVRAYQNAVRALQQK